MATISHQEAKQFYDRLGSLQDWQGFYENRAVQDMLLHGKFYASHAVCEFGCGTGKLASLLLARHLPDTASYLGLDLSNTMVGLAARRLEPWSDRAHVVRADGPPRIPASDGTFDRVLSTYVLDLLSAEDIRELLSEARRVLAQDGLLCNVSLTHGVGAASRAIGAAWRKINAWRPALLGGCRPLVLSDYLDAHSWKLEHRRVVCSFGICSEVTVAGMFGG